MYKYVLLIISLSGQKIHGNLTFILMIQNLLFLVSDLKYNNNYLNIIPFYKLHTKISLFQHSARLIYAD